jgi:high affinity sulfate transporter 1
VTSRFNVARDRSESNTTDEEPHAMGSNAEPIPPATGLAKYMPALYWLRNYDRAWFRGDFVAGVTLAAYLIPAGIGDASLAGLPPEAGLYACLFSGLVFWLFCSSRTTVITVTSAISLLVGSTLGQIADGDASRFGVLAACTALLVSLLAFLAWAVRAGSLINFISESVLIGFKSGVALYIASTQLPKLFGFKGTHGDFWERMHYFFLHIGEANVTALAIGLAALATLIAGRIFIKDRPVALFVVIAGIAAASLAGLEARGVFLLGEVPQGLPMPGVAWPGWQDLNELLPLALACFLLGAVETTAIGRTFCAKQGTRLDSNQEFLALGASNLAAGLTQGFPVSGGMSQSVVNVSGGARTPLSGLFAAGILLIVTLFLSGLLRNLPQPVLAAIVLVAIAGLLKVHELKRLSRVSRDEFLIASMALLGVLGSGLLRGVLIGAIISMLLLLRRVSRPHVAFLGRIPGTQRFSDMQRHEDNERIPGVVIFRTESSLFFFNVDSVRDAVMKFVQEETMPPKLVLCDLSSTPLLDVHAAETLAEMATQLGRMGITMEVVEARASVRDTLRVLELEPHLGSVNRYSSVAESVNHFLENTARA